MQPSAPMSLNATDKGKILKDLLYYALVPATFYITAVLGVIQLPHHVIGLRDFVPSNNTIIAIIAWLLNQVLNVIRKYIA